MKLLFISSRDVTKKTHGGFQCTNRNYLSFCELLGPDGVEVMNLSIELNESFPSRFFKWFNYFLGFWAGLSHKTVKKIINKANCVDYVFIDSSQFGIIAYYLKKAKYKGEIISFFHNVEYNIWREKLKKRPFSVWRAALLFYNEKKSVLYSDKIVTLNRRDLDQLKKIYKATNIRETIIPISFIDEYKDVTNPQKQLTDDPPTYLFIGNYWYPNIHGIKWFVKNVLDHVNIKLQIAGIGMEKLKNHFSHPKIEFLGYVPDLSLTIENSDFMISPIFKGSGMKVKTCEALMYGKNIVGTTEAFEGYEIDYKKIGAICNTKEEFISKIFCLSSSKKYKFNYYSREIFLTKYSFNSTLVKFKTLIQN